jgi:SAM-dependent methyltransferase
VGQQHEIDYIKTVAQVENVAEEEFRNYLRRKPYGDPDAADYLIDLGQILRFLPKPPARILDLGVGSGWTSEAMARMGHEVVGLDISPDMIALASERVSPGLNLRFQAFDYEKRVPFPPFDAVVMYDSLHHAVDEQAVIQTVATALLPGGRFICIEPGTGHSTAPHSVEVMAKYGTTEKDMPYTYVRYLLLAAGFASVQQYVRIRQQSCVDLAAPSGVYEQIQHVVSLLHQTIHAGLTSTIVGYR